MKAIPFKEANFTLRGNGENVADLPVYTDGAACVSVWEPTEEEIKDILKNKKIYVTIFHPPFKFPPVGLSTDSPLPTVFSLDNL